jgi:hypothetical protein
VPLDDPAFIVASTPRLMAELRMALAAGRDAGAEAAASSVRAGRDGHAACGK